MTVHDLSIGHEAAADFSNLLAEAALVLSEMASAEPRLRAEEYATLQEIHSEGDEFVGLPGIPAALRGLFESMLSLGAHIAASPETLPESTLAQVHVVETMARSIAAALDDTSDVSPHIDAINRSIAALTMASPHPRSLTETTQAARVALDQFVTQWTR